mmetsp:Transcript_52082/g.134760  ORF Transcript_52082/g.134760 Transcript_52082/m.134760 type:complete len:280 (+) Transcript_52082:747-1586(+)
MHRTGGPKKLNWRPWSAVTAPGDRGSHGPRAAARGAFRGALRERGLPGHRATQGGLCCSCARARPPLDGGRPAAGLRNRGGRSATAAAEGKETGGLGGGRRERSPSATAALVESVDRGAGDQRPQICVERTRGRPCGRTWLRLGGGGIRRRRRWRKRRGGVWLLHATRQALPECLLLAPRARRLAGWFGRSPERQASLRRRPDRRRLAVARPGGRGQTWWRARHASGPRAPPSGACSRRGCGGERAPGAARGDPAVHGLRRGARPECCSTSRRQLECRH